MPKRDAGKRERLKLLSWNIWQGYHLKEIISFLQAAEADIIGLQEVIEKDGTNTAAVIAEELGYHSAYYRAIEKTRLGFPQGNAVLSKYPIDKSVPYLLSDSSLYKGTAETEPRVAIEARILIANMLLTIFTTHLAYSHLFRDSEMRNMQVDHLIQLLPPTRTILLGDFNSHPDSSYMEKLNQIMQNTDTELTKPTWTVYPFDYEGFHETELRHRLDYIFVSKDILVRSFDVEDSTGSDHLPISAVVEVSP